MTGSLSAFSSPTLGTFRQSAPGPVDWLRMDDATDVSATHSAFISASLEAAASPRGVLAAGASSGAVSTSMRAAEPALALALGIAPAACAFGSISSVSTS